MRRIVLSKTGTGATNPAPMDTYCNPFNVGMGIVVSGTVTCTVQHTFDDVFSPGFDPSTATWFNHPTLASLTANADGNYAFPVTAIRLNVTAGTGTATLTIVQAGIGS
jgi:hypothetical protein